MTESPMSVNGPVKVNGPVSCVCVCVCVCYKTLTGRVMSWTE